MAILRLSPDAGLLTFDDGRVLVGGSPLRILRLTDAGATRVAGWFDGEAVVNDSASRRLAHRLLDTGIAHPTYDEVPVSTEDVTIVIPVKDDADGLASTLAALVDVAEIIVVDDGSIEPVLAPGCTVIRHDQALGPAAARNAGLAKVATPFVAFVDADVVPEAGWLKTLLPHFGDNRVAAVAPRVRSTPGVGLLARYEVHHSPLDLGDQPARVAPRSRVSYVPTACLVARVDALTPLTLTPPAPIPPALTPVTPVTPVTQRESALTPNRFPRAQRECALTPSRCTPVGPFDVQLRFGEDVDVIWRLGEAKKVVRYEPAAEVTHRPRRDLQAFARQRFGYGSAAAPLAKRHDGAVAPVIVSGYSAAAWALGSLLHPVLGLAAAAASTLTIRPKMQAIPNPDRLAVELSAKGNLHAGRQLASAVSRPWWPFAVAGSMLSRRVRRVTVAAFCVPALYDWIKRSEIRSTIDPVRYLALRAFDDLSYGAGISKGCIDEQTIDPLKPDLTNWKP